MTGPLSLLAEPPKSGVKEKRKKAASFQTVSQLHKVRPRVGPPRAGPPLPAFTPVPGPCSVPCTLGGRPLRLAVMFNSSPREHHSKSVLLPVPTLPGQGAAGSVGGKGIGWGRGVKASVTVTGTSRRGKRVIRIGVKGPMCSGMLRCRLTSP